MHSETFFDCLPGGGAQWSPDLTGPDGRLARLCKGGAEKPDDPPPVTAPYRAEVEGTGEASRLAGRKKGIQKTILSQDEDDGTDAAGLMPTLGRPTQLGVINPLLVPKNGGEA